MTKGIFLISASTLSHSIRHFINVKRKKKKKKTLLWRPIASVLNFRRGFNKNLTIAFYYLENDQNYFLYRNFTQRRLLFRVFNFSIRARIKFEASNLATTCITLSRRFLRSPLEKRPRIFFVLDGESARDKHLRFDTKAFARRKESQGLGGQTAFTMAVLKRSLSSRITYEPRMRSFEKSCVSLASMKGFSIQDEACKQESRLKLQLCYLATVEVCVLLQENWQFEKKF